MLPLLLLILLYSEAVVRCCSAKKVILQVSQNSKKENTKKDILAQIFSCEFCEISHNISFKEPFRRMLLHKHSFFLLSHHNLSHSHFLAKYFFDLICKLGTRVSLVFQTANQEPIFNPAEHLRWSSFCENS